MERLTFVCPVTKHYVDVGIDSELNTLLRIRENRVRALCQACGRQHEWLVSEAHLLPIAA